MNSLEELNEVQQNVLIASILGDGEITKIYKGSRRKQNSYREHFSIAQLEYRQWKQKILDPLIYFTAKNNVLLSKSNPLFTALFHDFYDVKGNKQIPGVHLKRCTHLSFLTTLYLDDGSLSISKRINHRLKKIYLVPNIYLYLQSFQLKDLKLLQKHIEVHFGFSFTISKRSDGFHHILRFTSVGNTYRFLKSIHSHTRMISSMRYKTDWNWRFTQEKEKFKALYPDYELFAGSAERTKPYSELEIARIIDLLRDGTKVKDIAVKTGRTYWSLVYKIRELKLKGII
ncbi:hypothetical protein [Alkalicoccus daliensis]|uniref:LAGLIDADG DNA endonuclease family protein n=1 Tax=Alkalicoccus daliensis TaxID=745820 RepID=A0A1H0IZ04_9BACI|nr:hypothetical protein [Alkalicoccus daliensis]SDO36737.1 LAGLIDADG DNA endonuclease family protein [Alkalicoccus daliensis]